MTRSFIYASFLLLLMALFASCHRATTTDPERGRQAVEQQPQDPAVALASMLELPSISPGDIRQYIRSNSVGSRLVELRPLWSRLGIASDDERVFDGFIPSYAPWQARVIDLPQSQGLVQTREKASLISILRIGPEGRENRRYLVFRLIGASASDRQWQFSGKIDIIDSYFTAETEYERIFTHDGTVFLIVRDRPRIGTGISAADEIWFKVDQDSPREVLRYPTEGGRVLGNISDVEYSAIVTEPRIARGSLIQEVSYSILFGVGPKPKFDWLFSKRVRAMFVWDRVAGAFNLAPESDVSNEELDSQFGSVEPTKFINYNFARLLKLGVGATPDQREWFARVIGEIRDPSKKAELAQALGIR